MSMTHYCGPHPNNGHLCIIAMSGRYRQVWLYLENDCVQDDEDGAGDVEGGEGRGDDEDRIVERTWRSRLNISERKTKLKTLKIWNFNRYYSMNYAIFYTF